MSQHCSTNCWRHQWVIRKEAARRLQLKKQQSLSCLSGLVTPLCATSALEQASAYTATAHKQHGTWVVSKHVRRSPQDARSNVSQLRDGTKQQQQVTTSDKA